jgi:hypothetical protein
MSIKWDKVTWYSKLLAVVLAVIIFYVGFNLGQKKKDIDSANPVPAKQNINIPTSVTIKTQNIKEENFTGTAPIISGSGTLAKESQAYVDKTVADFKKQADTDVPAMRKEFGADNPTANYEIDIDAKYIKSAKTESIVMTVYTYTGGAHGNSFYKVLTVSVANSKILSLANIIKSSEQAAFTEFLKKELNSWKPAGSDAPAVFPEDVAALTFNSFTNWSMDAKNLVIYFDQYEIGPGVLGPVAFPLPLEKIKNFLN